MFMLVWALVFMSYGPYVLWLPNETVLSWMCVAVFHVLLLLLLASCEHERARRTAFRPPSPLRPHTGLCTAAPTLSRVLPSRARLCGQT